MPGMCTGTAMHDALMQRSCAQVHLYHVEMHGVARGVLLQSTAVQGPHS